LKILHLTNWYPDENNPHRAKWIYNQIKTLNKYYNYDIYHIEVRFGRFEFIKRFGNIHINTLKLFIPIKNWFLIEILSGILLLYIIIKSRASKSYDVINFHIAYPLCTYLFLIKYFIKIPIIITEHWSAYHFKFNIKSENKLKRIKRIFNLGIPIIAVSNSLVNDIVKISKTKQNSYVLPNVVDTKIYKNLKIKKKQLSFFMISNWKDPKRPLLVLRAIANLRFKYPNIRLKIGGYGPQIDQINDFIYKFRLNNIICLLGELSARNVAKEMNEAVALIHPSNYETFSVVCAESLCCGTPVICSNVGGLKDNINHSNGILVNTNSPDAFEEAIIQYIDNISTFRNNEISEKSKQKYSDHTVGNLYNEIIQCLI